MPSTTSAYNSIRTHWSKYLLLGLLCFSAYAAEQGDEKGNGGGGAENNVLVGYQSVDRYIERCLNTVTCRVTEPERLILQKIFRGLPGEKSNPKPIEFRSEKLEPGFFVIDGQVKTMKTGSKVGSTIYVNVDLIYYLKKVGDEEEKIPMGVESAVALLIHELAHHQGEMDHTALDLLGAKVVELAYENKQTVAQNEVRILSASGFPAQVLVNTLEGNLDITTRIREQLRCPSRAVPNAFELRNLHQGWPKNHWPGRDDQLVIRGWLWMECESKMNAGWELDIELPKSALKTQADTLQTIKFTQVDCVEAKPRACR